MNWVATKWHLDETTSNGLSLNASKMTSFHATRDNAKIQSSKHTQGCFETYGSQVMEWVPYSSDLDPTELLA